MPTTAQVLGPSTGAYFYPNQGQLDSGSASEPTADERARIKQERPLGRHVHRPWSQSGRKHKLRGGRARGSSRNGRWPAHTRARTNAQARVRTHACARVHALTHPRTHACARTLAHACARAHARTHACACTNAHARTRVHARIRTHARTRTHASARSHTHARMNAHARERTAWSIRFSVPTSRHCRGCAEYVWTAAHATAVPLPLHCSHTGRCARRTRCTARPRRRRRFFGTTGTSSSLTRTCDSCVAMCAIPCWWLHACCIVCVLHCTIVALHHASWRALTDKAVVDSQVCAADVPQVGPVADH